MSPFHALRNWLIASPRWLLLYSASACSGNVSAAPKEGGLAGTIVLHQTIERFWVDESRLYWEARSDALQSCQSSDCAHTTITYGDVFQSVAVGAEKIFWQPKARPDSVVACAKTGCEGMSSPVLPSTTQVLSRLWADGDYLYWADAQNLYRCPSTGCEGMPEIVAAAAISDTVHFAGSNVYWLTWTGAPPNPAPNPAGQIWRAPKDGSEPASMIVSVMTKSHDVTPIQAVAVDEANVYWLDDANHIVSCPVAGCGNAPPTERVTSNDPKSALQVDATGFYWLQPDLGGKTAVRGCPLSGCGTDSQTLTTNDAWMFALDERYIYWASTQNDGSFTQYVRRVEKLSP